MVTDKDINEGECVMVGWQADESTKIVKNTGIPKGF